MKYTHRSQFQYFVANFGLKYFSIGIQIPLACDFGSNYFAIGIQKPLACDLCSLPWYDVWLQMFNIRPFEKII